MRQRLPFEDVSRIKELLTDDCLRGLMAVFSRRGRDDLLLVYADAPPEGCALPPASRVLSLAELHRWLDTEFASFDGPVVAHPAVDALYPDIPTKGWNVYALDHIFRERGLFAELRANWDTLARHMLAFLTSFQGGHLPSHQQARLRAKITALVTPSLLAQIPREHLIGVFPDPDLAAYVEDRRCHLVYTHPPADWQIPGVGLQSPADLETLQRNAGNTFPLVFEEIAETVGNWLADTLSLRALLRDSGLTDAMATTLEGLAWHLYTRRGPTPMRGESLPTAYALVLERWLLERELNDLVAVLPGAFDAFFHEGRARYVYITLPEPCRATSDREHIGLWEWLHAPEARNGVAFSLLPLRSLCLHLGVQHWQDLGPVLHKVGNTKVLARNAWLLVQEMRDWPGDKRRRWHLSRGIEFHTVARSCVLFSLEDPWQWRQGRHVHMLTRVYQVLVAILERLSQSTPFPYRHYYEALAHWYRCALVSDLQDVEAHLKQMLDTLQQCDVEPEEEVLHTNGDIQEQARSLKNVGTAILHMLSGGGQLDVLWSLYREDLEVTVSNVPFTRRQAVHMTQPLSVPTALFRGEFQHYAQIITEIQKIQSAAIPVADKVKLLRQQKVRLERAQNVAFAPIHEKHVLDLLYHRAIEHVLATIADLEGGAKLHVDLLTRSVTHHEDTQISFDVRNIGRVEARDIRVVLELSDHFHLRDQSAVKQLANIPPGGVERLAFTIRARVDEDLPIHLTVAYNDARAERHEYRHEFLVQVTSLDRGPFRLKPNPYIYGVPLQDPRLFYGRRQELESLLNHLASGRPQNILIRGARRSGKTSLLNMVQAVIADRERHLGARTRFAIPREWDPALNVLQPVLIDLQGVERPDNVLTPTAFFKAVLTALTEVGWGDDAVRRVVEQSHIRTQQFERTLRNVLKARRGQSVVLLLDEFDVVDLISDREFYAQLRHVISAVQGVTWIIASALGLYREVSDYESPLFNVFKIVDLGPLEREAARRLILDPWEAPDRLAGGEQGRLQFVDDAVDAILDETGCHPYFIQLLCSAVVERANARRTNYVLRRTVYEVIDGITAPRSALYEHFAYLWDRVGGMSKVILLVLLSRVDPPTDKELRQAVHRHLIEAGLHMGARQVDQAYWQSLHRLKVMEAITEDTRERLMFGIPLFRRLLQKRSEREDLWRVAFGQLQETGEMEGNHA